jgi:hypothetical protein
MGTVKTQVLETLMGTTESPELSKQMRSDFMKYAVKDAESDEWFLGENEFINAVAPPSEDYVSNDIKMELTRSASYHYTANVLTNSPP